MGSEAERTMEINRRPVFDRLVRTKPLAVVAMAGTLFVGAMASRSSEVVEPAAANHWGNEDYPPEYYQKAYNGMPSEYGNTCQDSIWNEDYTSVEYRPCSEEKRRNMFAHFVMYCDKSLGQGAGRSGPTMDGVFTDKTRKKFKVTLSHGGDSCESFGGKIAPADGGVGERTIRYFLEAKEPRSKQWRRRSPIVKKTGKDYPDADSAFKEATIKTDICKIKKSYSKSKIKKINNTKVRGVAIQNWHSFFGRDTMRVNRQREHINTENIPGHRKHGPEYRTCSHPIKVGPYKWG